jgi:hypothetical protein
MPKSTDSRWKMHQTEDLLKQKGQETKERRKGKGKKGYEEGERKSRVGGSRYTSSCLDMG